MFRLNKRGLFNMLVGAGLFFACGFLFIVSTMSTGGFYLEFMLVFMVLGSIQFLVGLFQTIAYGLKGKKGRSEYHKKICKRWIVKSMAAVAAADETLNHAEVAAIQEVTETLYGKPRSSRKIVRDVQAVLSARDYDILDLFEKDMTFMEPEFPELILKAMVLTAKADGKINPYENGTIIRLAKFLDLPGPRLRELQNTENFDLGDFSVL